MKKIILVLLKGVNHKKVDSLYYVSQIYISIRYFIYMIEFRHNKQTGERKMIIDITQAVIISIITLIISTIVAIIGYFLKRTITRVDKCEEKIEKIPSQYESTKAHNDDMREVKAELKGIKDDIKDISNEFLKTEEFIRKMLEINHKFDRIEDKIDKNARITDSKLDKLLAGLNKED